MLNHIIESNPITTLLNKLFNPQNLLSDLSTYFSSILSLSSTSTSTGNYTKTQKLFFTIGLAHLTYKLV